MCSSSLMSSSAGRSDLFRNYRFITADKSQLCDGRNLESVRILSSAEPSETTDKVAVSDNVKPMEGNISSDSVGRVKGYRPTSSRSRAEVQPRQQEETQQHSQPQEQPSAKPKATSFLPSPLSLESDHALDDSYQEFIKESQAASREDKKSVKTERSATTQHESRDSTESRSSNQQRRASDSLTTSSQSSGTRVTMRKLSEPMHRCSHTNASVNGIMRPARYSSLNLSAMADTSSAPKKASNETIRHCTSQLSLHTRSTASLSKSTSSSNLVNQGHSEVSLPLSRRRSADLIKPTKPRRRMSIADMANANWSSYPTPVNQEAKDNWVASGVAFSQSMEVYVFKK
jgi:hypothetical protein